MRKNRKGFGRRIKHNLRVDMTPMVDLGFLLISFFVMATQLSQPKVMDLYMPAEGPPTDLGLSNALTIILDGDNRIYYYHGDWESASSSGDIFQTSYSGKTGLRNIIEAKQRALDQNSKSKEGRSGMMLLIKPTQESSYKNLVDVLDEIIISMVKKYAIIPLTPGETAWLEK